MTKILCDISALRYYRTPPRYLYALPPIPDFDTPYGRSQLRKSPIAASIIGVPIHALRIDQDRLTSTLVKQHLWTKRMPAEAVVDTPFDVSVTSPLMTLLMLSTHLDPIQTALLIYEFTGTFSFFTPNYDLEQSIFQAVNRHTLEKLDSWQRIINAKGMPTALWRRPPLLELDDIQELIDSEKGMRGRNRLAQALRYVTGKTASPFEAKASMLIGSSWQLGGLGLGQFDNNKRIKLNDSAQQICGQKNAYGDLVWEETPTHPMVIVECQGEMVHDAPGRARADDDRALALESMGARVIRISHSQIACSDRFDLLAKRLVCTLGAATPPSTPETARRQEHMRGILFGSWPYCKG